MENPLNPINIQETSVRTNPLPTPISKKKLPLKMILGVGGLVVLGVGVAAVLFLSTQRQDVRQQASGGTCTSVGECLNGHVCVIGPNDTVTPTGASCDPNVKMATAYSAPATRLPDGVCMEMNECINGHVCLIGSDTILAPTGAACDPTTTQANYSGPKLPPNFSPAPAYSAVAQSSGGYVISPVYPTPSPVAQASPIPSPVPQGVPQPGTDAQRTGAFKTITAYKPPSSTQAAVAGSQINGTVCKYGSNYVAGTALFYNMDTKTTVQTKVTAGTNFFSLSVPLGNTVAIFYPDDLTLPPFAYTAYITCGMHPDSCTDHSPLIMQVKSQVYGSVKLCDPQVNYQGLPNALYQ